MTDRIARVADVRRIVATFLDAAPAREAGLPGVWLGFRAERSRLGIDRLDDFAALGPARSLAAIEGIGKVLRVLRAGRVAVQGGQARFLDDAVEAARYLGRAAGTALLLDLMPRSRLRFVAWTDAGMETLDDVSDVVEAEDAFLVYRRGRLPVRVLRTHVIRQLTERQRWYQVVGIERAPGRSRVEAAADGSEGG